MSAINVALMGHLARQNMGFAFQDDLSAGPAAAQATALPVITQCTRVTVASSTGSMLLPDILTNNSPNLMFLLNDSANTINVYAFSGQNVNGSLNGFLAIAAGGFGIFVRLKANLDWRSAAFT